MFRLAFMTLGILLIVSTGWAVAACAEGQKGGEIIHDAEYYVLEAQNGERWAAEDKELDKRLSELQKKHGRSTEGRPTSSTSCGTTLPSVTSVFPRFRKFEVSRPPT